MSEYKTCQVLECVQQMCMWCAYVMHDQGMTKHTWVKVCKTHNQWSNMHNHGNSQNLLLIEVQNNTKMPFGHFIKYLVCTNTS